MSDRALRRLLARSTLGVGRLLSSAIYGRARGWDAAMNASAIDGRSRRVYNPVQRDAATFLETPAWPAPGTAPRTVPMGASNFIRLPAFGRLAVRR